MKFLIKFVRPEHESAALKYLVDKNLLVQGIRIVNGDTYVLDNVQMDALKLGNFDYMPVTELE